MDAKRIESARLISHDPDERNPLSNYRGHSAQDSDVARSRLQDRPQHS